MNMLSLILEQKNQYIISINYIRVQEALEKRMLGFKIMEASIKCIWLLQTN
jgi:hypothetical protein